MDWLDCGYHLFRGDNMDYSKIGKLIFDSSQKKMTQKNVAKAMNISDKTISKWER